jgi:hypothetical protein
MPAHERLGADNREDLQNRWKQSIQLDQELAIAVREPDPARNLALQNDQLMSEGRILRLEMDSDEKIWMITLVAEEGLEPPTRGL